MNHKRKFGIWKLVETDAHKIPVTAVKFVIRIPWDKKLSTELED